MIAHDQTVDLDLVVGAVIADAPRGFRRQLQQRLDGAGGRLAGAQLQHLAEQHQYGNDRGGFEVDRNRAAMAAEGGREAAGREGADQAVEVGDTGAHRDQGEHVEIARLQRLPAAHKEGPARPQHHGRGEHHLDPVRQRRVDPAVTADQMPPHLEHHRRNREHEADPEASRHVGEFGIGRRVQAGHLGLERHAADRATSRTDLADFRMHRAGVDRALRCRRLRLALVEPGFWIGGELGAAAGGAKVIRLAAVVEPVLAGGGIDGHAADGIDHLCAGMGMIVVMTGMAVAAAGLRRPCVFSVGHGALRSLHPIPCRGI